MKIIDLLNRIAKGEEVPKKVSINRGIHGIDVWEYDENCKDYMSSSNIMLLYSGMTSNHLTDEVEILKEVEDKEYENIQELKNKRFTRNQKQIAGKINQIIRNQKKLLEKIESGYYEK